MDPSGLYSLSCAAAVIITTCFIPRAIAAARDSERNLVVVVRLVGLQARRLAAVRRSSRRGTRYLRLGVVVLDPAAVVGAAARAAATTAPAATARRRRRTLLAPDAQQEQDARDEQRRVRAPREAECVLADAGVDAGGLEGVARLDESNTWIQCQHMGPFALGKAEREGGQRTS